MNSNRQTDRQTDRQTATIIVKGKQYYLNRAYDPLDTGINGASKMASDLRAPWRDGVRIKSAREAREQDL